MFVMVAISCLVMEIDAMHMIYHKKKLAFWRDFLYHGFLNCV